MKVYLIAFINFEQNVRAGLLPMAKFTYNNAKNASTSHTLFKLNCGYHPWMSYKEEVNPRSQFKLVDELWAELKELMIVFCKNLYYGQEFQKRANDKRVKPWNYAPSKKV